MKSAVSDRGGPPVRGLVGLSRSGSAWRGAPGDGCGRRSPRRSWRGTTGCPTPSGPRSITCRRGARSFRSTGRSRSRPRSAPATAGRNAAVPRQHRALRLIPDPKGPGNPFGLPVGMSFAPSKISGIQMIGHQLHGLPRRADPVPGTRACAWTADRTWRIINAFLKDLRLETQETLQSPARLSRFWAAGARAARRAPGRRPGRRRSGRACGSGRPGC